MGRGREPEEKTGQASGVAERPPLLPVRPPLAAADPPRRCIIDHTRWRMAHPSLIPWSWPPRVGTTFLEPHPGISLTSAPSGADVHGQPLAGARDLVARLLQLPGAPDPRRALMEDGPTCRLVHHREACALPEAAMWREVIFTDAHPASATLGFILMGQIPLSDSHRAAVAHLGLGRTVDSVDQGGPSAEHIAVWDILTLVDQVSVDQYSPEGLQALLQIRPLWLTFFRHGRIPRAESPCEFIRLWTQPEVADFDRLGLREGLRRPFEALVDNPHAQNQLLPRPDCPPFDLTLAQPGPARAERRLRSLAVEELGQGIPG